MLSMGSTYIRKCMCMSVWVCVCVCDYLKPNYWLLATVQRTNKSGSRSSFGGILNYNALHTTNYRIHCIVLIYMKYLTFASYSSYPKCRTDRQGGNSIQFQRDFIRGSHAILQFWYNLVSVCEKGESLSSSFLGSSKRITRYT